MKTSRNPYKVMLIVFLILECAIIATAMIARYAVPEPEQCALHDLAGRYHAPLIMNLATGEIAEMRIYDPDPERPWLLNANQRTGYFHFFIGAGLSGYVDGGLACHVDLPRAGVAMNDGLFCRKCRLLLAVAEKRGFAILDLHDPEHIRPYAMIKGQEYEINGYTVNIEKGRLPFSLTVNVAGHLFDEPSS